MPAAKGSARTPLGPISKIVATFVYASSQGQRTHSARTNSGHLRLCQQPRAAHALRSDQLCENKFKNKDDFTCEHLAFVPATEDSITLFKLPIEHLNYLGIYNNIDQIFSDQISFSLNYEVICKESWYDLGDWVLALQRAQLLQAEDQEARQEARRAEGAARH
jgi:hypothetical protein